MTVDEVRAIQQRERARVRAISPDLTRSASFGTAVSRRIVPRMNVVKRAVNRQFYSYWQENNWTHIGTRYTGCYRTPFGAYEGFIEETYEGHLEFFLKNAPECLDLHPHRACFRQKGRGLLFVHFAQEVSTPDAGIREIEHVLTQAHELEIGRYSP